MKIIVPMAGRGSRLRPHTLLTPKPLIPIVGKPIVQRLVEDIAAVHEGNIEEIAFIIGDFGSEVEKQLIEIATSLGAKGSIYVQDQPLGTAHAIYQAHPSMEGEVVVAFADTLFVADFVLDRSADSVIWAKRVDDPSAFGVLQLDDDGKIEAFVEKPQTFVSDLAIIGIYYFKDGANLASELKYLLDHDIRVKGEYQLTDALENMRAKGLKFVPGEVQAWMDCGNKAAVLDTTRQVLAHEAKKGVSLVAESAELTDTVVIPPCFIGEHVKISNAVIGPYVSIEAHTVIRNAVVRDSAIRSSSLIENTVLDQAMIGSHATYSPAQSTIDMGDYASTHA